MPKSPLIIACPTCNADRHRRCRNVRVRRVGRPAALAEPHRDRVAEAGLVHAQVAAHMSRLTEEAKALPGVEALIADVVADLQESDQTHSSAAVRQRLDAIINAKISKAQRRAGVVAKSQLKIYEGLPTPEMFEQLDLDPSEFFNRTRRYFLWAAHMDGELDGDDIQSIVEIVDCWTMITGELQVGGSDPMRPIGASVRPPVVVTMSPRSRAIEATYADLREFLGRADRAVLTQIIDDGPWPQATTDLSPADHDQLPGRRWMYDYKRPDLALLMVSIRKILTTWRHLLSEHENRFTKIQQKNAS